ncbi:MAG: response regulator, partial [Candidatus Ornithospirochaeta sp.]
SSLFTGMVFFVTEGNVYTHGKYYFIYMIAYFSAAIYMTVKMIVTSLKEKHKDVYILIGALVMVLTGIIIQAIYSFIKIDWCAAAMASTLVCMTYITQDQKRSVEEMKKAMEEAKRANSAKTTFMGRMSHDVRTPINGIMGMVQIAKKNEDKREVVADCLEKIDYSSRHLLSLVSDILQMTSLESGAITLTHESFSLSDTMDQCMMMVQDNAKERGVRVIVDGFDELEGKKVMGSPVHVRQIFINIITNAIKYNKIGGFVEIKCAEIGKGEDSVTYRFTFSDTGLGMSDEYIKRIFEPFSREDDPTTSHRPGSGLGMSIVKELVTLMGGSISVISEKNVGSIFTVDLPFELDKSPEDKEKGNKIGVSFKGKRVLLVEDNELNLEIAKYMLDEKEFVVDTAANGKEALGKYLSSPQFYYQLVLMDIMMPVMNGLEATRAIRSSGRSDYQIPILAMTANAYEEDKRECLDAGMDGHISKPLDEGEMFSTISKILSGGRLS